MTELREGPGKPGRHPLPGLSLFIALALVVGLASPVAAADATVVPTPLPTGATASVLRTVACTSATNCFAGGDATVAGVKSRFVLRWNGTAWSIVTTPAPPGTTESTISGSTCPSATSCWLVGSATVSGAQTALALRWNGTTWSVVTAPAPVGATASALFGVTCTGTTACWAVGVARVSGVDRRLLLRWNGTSWASATAPSPAGATASRLDGVGCATATSCWAVGYATILGFDNPLLYRWNGSIWSAVTPPQPSGTTDSRLASVACTATNDCWAVGQAKVSGTNQRMILRWNGTAWSLTAATLPVNYSDSVLSGVACATASDCWAVGRAKVSGIIRQLALRWNGTAWTVVATPNGPGSAASSLLGVTCSTATDCWGLGYSILADGEVRRLVLSLTGTATASSIEVVPTALPAGTQYSTLRDVTCASTSACWAVGMASVDYTENRLLLRWNGTAWLVAPSPLPPGATASSLDGVACATASDCWAVGSYDPDGLDTARLMLRWNGTAWSLVTTPLPAGATGSSLTDVTCSSATNCWAVGQVTVADTVRRLVLRWNGTAWAVTTTSLPTGTVESRLAGVTCASSSSCWAVGAFSVTARQNWWDPPVAEQRMVLRWNGTAWTSVAAPAPSGTTTSELNDVACSGVSACWAVGDATTTGPAQRLAMRWNGTAWSLVSVPNPSGATASRLAGVTCTSASNCWAVGAATISGIERRMVVRWNGTAWTGVTTPLPVGTSSSALAAMTCRTATFCWAVGYAAPLPAPFDAEQPNRLVLLFT